MHKRIGALAAAGSVIVGGAWLASGQLAGATIVPIPAGTIITTAGNGSGPVSGIGGPAQDAGIGGTTAVATGADGSVYIASFDECEVFRVTPDGTISNFAGTGVCGQLGEPGPASAAEIGNPNGVAVDRSGNVYIADSPFNVVWQVTPAGTINRFAGGGANNPKQGGAALDASLSYPLQLAADNSGDIFISDSEASEVDKVNPAGDISVVAGTGTAGDSGNGGPATAARLNLPDGLFADASGDLYIADPGDNVVRRVDANGVITTAAGTGTAGLSGDGGPATGAKLEVPAGVTGDTLGDLYIADSGNNMVREVNASGVITTIAGTGDSSYSGDGSAATAAALNDPLSVTVDAYGDVVIADTDNQRVRTVLEAAPPASQGYHLVASDGGIFSHGSANFEGSEGGTKLNAPIVGMAETPDAHGYWLVATDGGIFSHGDANFYGSTGSIHLNKPVVGMAATPDGKGYWLVASDGGIFNYGDANFHGSMGGVPLNAPIVGMAATPDGGGYWEVASDGGIFGFGDAAFYGSTGSIHLNKPVVGMAATPDGRGYWLVATDGGIFNYGDANFYGSTGSIHLNKPVVGMAATPDGSGYWMVATDGGIFNYGDAGFYGSEGATPLNQPIVGMASGVGYPPLPTPQP